MKIYKEISNQKGASAVEFAIVLPLLVVIIFGIIEFGVILYDKAMITNASRVGARFGILYDAPVYPNSDGDIDTHVMNFLNNGNLLINLGGPKLDPGNIDVVTTPTSRKTGDLLTVNVSFSYDFLVVPNFVTILPDSLTISGITTMRME